VRGRPHVSGHKCGRLFTPWGSGAPLAYSARRGVPGSRRGARGAWDTWGAWLHAVTVTSRVEVVLHLGGGEGAVVDTHLGDVAAEAAVVYVRDTSDIEVLSAGDG